MATHRTLPEKVQDVKTTFVQFSEMLTPPNMREMLDAMTNAEAREQVAQAGDVRALTDLVRASIEVQKVIAQSDRTALIAAVMTTQSGVSRPIITDSGEPES